MSLMDQLSMSTFTAKDTDRYLMNLYRTNPMRLSEEINQVDASGVSPLVLAIQRENLELTEVLLSFDAQTTVKISGKTMEEIAREASEETGIIEESRNKRKKVYALLQSRGAWQAASARDQGISFSRSIKAIEEAVENIQGAQGRNGVLVLGITGEGKSTCINFLDGVNYKSVRVKGLRRVERISGQEELAIVGSSTTSETLYPKVFNSREGSYVHVDMPGFEDTRGTAEEICAAASICMLTKQLASIQAVCLVASWASLADPRMVNYRKSAESIGGMIGIDATTAENVILVVTKPESDLTAEDVIARLEELAEAEEFSEMGKVIASTGEVSPDIKRKMALKNATEAILQRGGAAIILADVTRPEVRAEVHQTVQRLQRVTKRPEQFNFNGYSRYMTGFQLVLENIIINHNELKRALLNQHEKIKGITEAIDALETEILKLNEEIASYEKQKSEPFTEAQFEQKIKEARATLNELRGRYSSEQIKLRTAENEEMRDSARLEAMSARDQDEKLIHVVNQSWVCEKTAERTETDIEEVGSPVQLMDGSWAQGVKRVQKVVPGTEKTVSEAVSYPSPVPIKRIVDRSIGGQFNCGSFTPGTKNLSGTFVSTPGANGGVSLNVELYGDYKDFPEAKERISALTSEIANAKDTLGRLRTTAVKSTAVDTAEATLTDLELERITAIGNHERTQMVCEMQIALRAEQKVRAEEKKGEFAPQKLLAESELESVNLQLEVNQKLFTTLGNVIMALGFRSEVIDQFMALFSGNSYASSAVSAASATSAVYSNQSVFATKGFTTFASSSSNPSSNSSSMVSTMHVGKKA